MLGRIPAAREHCIMHRKQVKYRLDFAVLCRKGCIDIECDNEQHHSQKAQRRKDRRRDAYLKRRGWEVLRFTGRDIVNKPNTCLAVIRQTIRTLGGLSREEPRGVREEAASYAFGDPPGSWVIFK